MSTTNSFIGSSYGAPSDGFFSQKTHKKKPEPAPTTVKPSTPVTPPVSSISTG